MHGTIKSGIDYDAFKKAAEALKRFKGTSTQRDRATLLEVAAVLKPYCDPDRKAAVVPEMLEIFMAAALTIDAKFSDTRRLHHFIGNARGTARKPEQYTPYLREPVYKFFAAVGSMR